MASTIQGWQCQQVSNDDVVALTDTADIRVILVEFLAVWIALSSFPVTPLLLFPASFVLPCFQLEPSGTAGADVSPGSEGSCVGPVSNTLTQVSIILLIKVALQTLADCPA